METHCSVKTRHAKAKTAIKPQNAETKSEYVPERGNPKNLKRALEEYERRIKEAENKVQPGEEVTVPEMLVASGVDFTWLEKEKPKLGLKVRLEDGNLFIVSSRKGTHGDIKNKVCGMVGNWCWSKFDRLVRGSNARIQEFEPGSKSEPDVSIIPELPWDDNDKPPKARVIFEFEDGNRDVAEIRRHGFKMLTASHFTRVFVSIKIHRYFGGGVGAVAVVWRKLPAAHAIPAIAPIAPAAGVTTAPPIVWPPPVTPADHLAQQTMAAPAAAAAMAAFPAEVIQVAASFNFGPDDVSLATTASYTCPAGPDDLPPLTGMPVHPPPFAFGVPRLPTPPAWLIRIPDSDALYLTRDTTGNVMYLSPSAVGTNDLEIDLSCIRTLCRPDIYHEYV